MEEYQADLTVDEFVQITRQTKGTVYRLCRQGQIRSYRVGRSIRIPRSFVDEIRSGVAQ